jgi:uncharacterized membrane protein
MGELVQWLQQHIQEHSLLYFIALYILGGKPVALITAKVCGLDLAWLFPLVILMDAIQIPCFYYLYGHLFRYRGLSRMSNALQVKVELAAKKRPFQALNAFGPLGVLLLSMLPIKGGGIWSAVFLARLTGLPMKQSFPLLICGSILSSLVFVGLGDGLIRLWRLIV